MTANCEVYLFNIESPSDWVLVCSRCFSQVLTVFSQRSWCRAHSRARMDGNLQHALGLLNVHKHRPLAKSARAKFAAPTPSLSSSRPAGLTCIPVNLNECIAADLDVCVESLKRLSYPHSNLGILEDALTAYDSTGRRPNRP